MKQKLSGVFHFDGAAESHRESYDSATLSSWFSLNETPAARGKSFLCGDQRDVPHFTIINEACPLLFAKR